MHIPLRCVVRLLTCSRGNALTWPIFIPSGASYDIIRIINDLNDALNYWGYRENQKEVWQRLTVQYERALRGGVLDSWMLEAQDRVMEGEEVLVLIQDALMSLSLRGIPPEMLREVWASITATSLNVQYIVAATTVHIDLAAQEGPVL